MPRPTFAPGSVGRYVQLILFTSINLVFEVCMSLFAQKEDKVESSGSAPAPLATAAQGGTPPDSPAGGGYRSDENLRPQSGVVSRLMSYWAEPKSKGKGGPPVCQTPAADSNSESTGSDVGDKSELVDTKDAAALLARITVLLSGDSKACIDPAKVNESMQLLQAASPSVRKEVLIKLRTTATLDVLLNNLGPEDISQWSEWIPNLNKPGDLLIPSDNPERAAQARTELLVFKLSDFAGRLTDSIIELLVFGVARRSSANAQDNNGLIGIEQANRAARALILMPQQQYLHIVSQLVMAGGNLPQNASTAADPRTESILLLKAVAARLDEFTGTNATATDKADRQVGQFGDDIRGKNAEQLKTDTTLRDRGANDGLQQKFTMTCGPTALQIVHGDVDPIFALGVSKESKHDLNYNSNVAKEQSAYLGKTTIPQLVEDDYQTFNTAIVRVAPSDVAKAAALQQWIAGTAADPKLLVEGQTLAIGLGFSQSRLLEFRTYYPYLGTGRAPGWQNSELSQKANAELSSSTGGSFNERAIPPSYKTRVPISTMKPTDIQVLWDKLFRGIDVPMGIMWTSGGGHFMVFTGCKNSGTDAAPQREFRLADPASGQSAWITEVNVLAGNISPFGTGAIDSLYL